jgi:aryl-alcohol dehydrogenase-like predicted oxidoreductase
MSLVPQRQFGRLDICGSVIGLGTVKWGRNQKVKYAPFELPDDQTLLCLLDEAEALGINVIDTAPAYGISEERVGKLLQGRRERFTIVTKVGEEFVNGESVYDFSAAAIEQSVLRSLQRLNTERLEFVLLHCPPNDLPAITDSPALEILAQLKAKGFIRYYGVSSMTLEGGLKAVGLSDAVMVAWNYLYRDQESVIRKAGELGKAVFLKKALLSGNLHTTADGKSLVENCVHAALDLPEMSSLIGGTINLAHLRENAAAAGNWSLKA